MQPGCRNLLCTLLLITGIVVVSSGLLATLLLNDSSLPATCLLGERPGDVVSGTLYFLRPCLDPDRQMWARRAGDRRGALLAEGVEGEPSYQRHGDHRWFLTMRPGTGSFRPVGPHRLELFAVRDDGRAVQLTKDPGLEALPGVARWVPGSEDRRISWVGRRWGGGGEIVEGGVYQAVVSFDAAGDLVGLAESPARLCLPLDLIESGGKGQADQAKVPDIHSHDWSPDGESIVYDSRKDQLVIVELRTGKTVVVEGPASSPSWSPEGKWIAFKREEPYGEIVIVHPDGTGMTKAIDPAAVSAWFTVSSPLWSPDGGRLLYRRLVCDTVHFDAPCEVDAVAMTLDGHERVNLTYEVPGFAYPVAWR